MVVQEVDEGPVIAVDGLKGCRGVAPGRVVVNLGVLVVVLQERDREQAEDEDAPGRQEELREEQRRTVVDNTDVEEEPEADGHVGDEAFDLVPGGGILPELATRANHDLIKNQK